MSTWDDQVEASFNGTIFHTKKFLSYHGKQNWCHMDLPDGLLPGKVVDNVLRSPWGASYGGFVFPPYLSIQKATQCVADALQRIKELGLDGMEITPAMQVYHSVQDEVQEYALLHNGFKRSRFQYSSVIDVQNVNADAGRVSDINRAIRDGVFVKISQDYDAFYPLLVKNKQKFDARPVHSLAEMKNIASMFSCKLFLAYIEGQVIGGLWVLPVSKRCALIFYSAHDYEFRKYNAIPFLVSHATQWARHNRYKYLDYGVSTDPAAEEDIQWSLAQFKERLGATGCLRQTFQI